MLQCLSLKSSASTSTTTVPAVENSREDTPRSISQTSPTVNLTREYTLAVQTNSYNEIWSKIHVRHQDDYTNTDPDQDTDGEREEDVQQLRLAHVLRPDRECVQDALRHARSNTLTRLVSDYFDHSENTSQLCLLLHRSVHHAHSLYSPLHDLLDILPLDSDSLTQSQCNQAFDVFLQFDSLDNPFPCPDSHNFRDMRRCFSQLKEQLDGHIRKSGLRFALSAVQPLDPPSVSLALPLGLPYLLSQLLLIHSLPLLPHYPLYSFLPGSLRKSLPMGHSLMLQLGVLMFYAMIWAPLTASWHGCTLLLRVTSVSFALDWRVAGTSIPSKRWPSISAKTISISSTNLRILRNIYASALPQSTEPGLYS
ncbi:UPF0496 protein [Vitis vinifera]|uniref:UPF0496 protein n=1 Tax=Vitis vinifera TaxID=29760 RepID=A0A438ETP4_VITVI|nr:UPF0496 protein [Vitis vinifera]